MRILLEPFRIDLAIRDVPQRMGLQGPQRASTEQPENIWGELLD